MTDRIAFAHDQPGTDGPADASSSAPTPTPALERVSTQSQRVLSVYNMTLNAKHHGDPWEHRNIKWFRVFLTIVTYSLVLSDVMRTGARPQLNMRHIGMGSYAFFGAYAYPLMTYTRDRYDRNNITALYGGAVPVDHAKVWSYTYDTTSTEIRSITQDFDTTGSYVLQCMNYKIKCDHMGIFPLNQTFDMLDQVVDSLALTSARDQLPQILPRQKLPKAFQHTRRAGVIKRRLVNILYEYLTYPFVESLEMVSYRITHFPLVDADFDPCEARDDRPFLCDADPISDYTLTADPADPGSVAIGFIPDAVQQQVLTTFNDTRNLSSNIVVDVTFFEGYYHPMTFTGGMAVAATAGFEIVKLTRVRDCSGSDGCKTIRIEDFRFEGGRLITNIDDWKNLVAALRIIAQTYFIVRVLGLFAGCYFAFPVNKRSIRRTVFLFFSEIPGHVVAYGSPLPIILYALAMCIDGPVNNVIIQFGAVRLQGSWMSDPPRIYQLICILMRRQWLMAAIAMIWIKIQVSSSLWDRHHGLLSVRGHIFGILSTMSMILGYHHPNFRDTRILELVRDNPHVAVMDIGIYSRDVSNQRVSGAYADIFSLMLCAAVYAMAVFFVRLVRHTVLLLFSKAAKVSEEVVPVKAVVTKTGSCRGCDPTTCVAEVTPRGNGSGNLFFCRTQLLPSTCGTAWSQLGLTCGWRSDLILSLLGQEQPRKVENHIETILLMNIVQLSEPLNYLLLRTGFTFTEIITYRDVETKVSFTVAEDLERVHVVAEERKAKKFMCVGKRSIQEVPFHDLVQCR